MHGPSRPTFGKHLPPIVQAPCIPLQNTRAPLVPPGTLPENPTTPHHRRPTQVNHPIMSHPTTRSALNPNPSLNHQQTCDPCWRTL